ncbi:hypothetical protein HID58_040860 [Brassica napus]|uniref:Uncharacterized protein n=1 Tax=Brassica napus TaxID=3708 RepID=A0ABQ8BA71_BRANA|nr:hypothetical protein HID58_040860 [Brassica napus]
MADQVASFLLSEIGNSKTTLFWFDNWLRVGRLLNITGPSGTQVWISLATRRSWKRPLVDNGTFFGVVAITYGR